MLSYSVEYIVQSYFLIHSLRFMVAANYFAPSLCWARARLAFVPGCWRWVGPCIRLPPRLEDELSASAVGVTSGDILGAIILLAVLDSV